MFVENLLQARDDTYIVTNNIMLRCHLMKKNLLRCGKIV